MKRKIIKPEGWINELVFDLGDWHCGKAESGICIRINNEAGGVLTQKQMRDIISIFTKHLDKYKLEE